MTRPARCRRPRTARKREVITTRRLLLENFRPDDDVGDVGLILERHEEDAFRGTRPLPYQHQPGDGHAHILAQFLAPQPRIGMAPSVVRRSRKKRTGCAFSDRPVAT